MIPPKKPCLCFIYCYLDHQITPNSWSMISKIHEIKTSLLSVSCFRSSLSIYTKTSQLFLLLFAFWWMRFLEPCFKNRVTRSKVLVVCWEYLHFLSCLQSTCTSCEGHCWLFFLSCPWNTWLCILLFSMLQHPGWYVVRLYISFILSVNLHLLCKLQYCFVWEML